MDDITRARAELEVSYLLSTPIWGDIPKERREGYKSQMAKDFVALRELLKGAANEF